MKRFLLLFILTGYAFGQVDNPDTVGVDNNQAIIEKNDIFRKHNLSIGLFDDKTVFSFVSYTQNIRQTEMDEFFIGAGTFITGFTGSAGWKHYYKKSKLSFYSVLSGQVVASKTETYTDVGYYYETGEELYVGFWSTISLSAEYNLLKRVQVKIGGVGAILLGNTSDEFKVGELGVLPFVGLNFWF